MFIRILLSAVLVAQAWAIKYTDCGSKTGKIHSIKITGCDETDVCEFKRGENYKIDMSFESFTESNRLLAVLHGLVAGISMPFPLQKPNACEHSDIECPLKSGQIYDYAYEIEVRNSYPVVRADVKWELRDDSNQNVVCVILPIKIV